VCHRVSTDEQTYEYVRLLFEEVVSKHPGYARLKSQNDANEQVIKQVYERIIYMHGIVNASPVSPNTVRKPEFDTDKIAHLKLEAVNASTRRKGRAQELRDLGRIGQKRFEEVFSRVSLCPQ
jgi:hypothetical protein